MTSRGHPTETRGGSHLYYRQVLFIYFSPDFPLEANGPSEESCVTGENGSFAVCGQRMSRSGKGGVALPSGDAVA